MVEKLAKQAAKRLPACVEMDEMIAAGNLGLVEAAQRYRPELHPSFEAYARLRVFGAIIDAFRGPNYPRRYEEIPDAWLQGGVISCSDEVHGMGRSDYSKVPPELIDPQPLPDAVLIREQEEHRAVVCITSARQKLSREEGRALDAHLNGDPMRRVGKKAKRSGAWAHYTIHGAKRKLRAAYEEIDKAA